MNPLNEEKSESASDDPYFDQDISKINKVMMHSAKKKTNRFLRLNSSKFNISVTHIDHDHDHGNHTSACLCDIEAGNNIVIRQNHTPHKKNNTCST